MVLGYMSILDMEARLMAATDEGAARKYKEKSISQHFSLYIYSGFTPKKPINSSKS